MIPTKVGTCVGMTSPKDGRKSKFITAVVKHVPNTFYNLLSVSKAMTE